jgi:hypothetical protein
MLLYLGKSLAENRENMRSKFHEIGVVNLCVYNSRNGEIMWWKMHEKCCVIIVYMCMAESMLKLENKIHGNYVK